MMEKVESLIAKMVNEVEYPHASELFKRLSGGKRLRARLILTIAPNSDLSPLLGAIVELIHAASLLHDDVIDEAKVRRGTPSINATEGSKAAIMLGDILYSKAFSELTVFDPKISKMIAESVTRLSVGEMMDVEMSKTFNTNRDLYLKMLYLKTATLIESAASSAALLAGKDPSLYARYGKNIGLAFQIVDDILDIISDEETLGKPALNDYVEGKVTLPYMDLYEQLEESDRIFLQSCHAKPLSLDDKAWIRSNMDRFGIIQSSYAYASDLCMMAIKSLENETSLVSIAESVMKRKN